MDPGMVGVVPGCDLPGCGVEWLVAALALLIGCQPPGRPSQVDNISRTVEGSFWVHRGSVY